MVLKSSAGAFGTIKLEGFGTSPGSGIKIGIGSMGFWTNSGRETQIGTNSITFTRWTTLR